MAAKSFSVLVIIFAIAITSYGQSSSDMTYTFESSSTEYSVYSSMTSNAASDSSSAYTIESSSTESAAYSSMTSDVASDSSSSYTIELSSTESSAYSSTTSDVASASELSSTYTAPSSNYEYSSASTYTNTSSSAYYSSTSSNSTSSSTYIAPSGTYEYSSNSTYTTPSSSTYYPSTSSNSTSSSSYIEPSNTYSYDDFSTSEYEYTTPSSSTYYSSTSSSSTSSSNYTASSSTQAYEYSSTSTYTATSSSTYYNYSSISSAYNPSNSTSTYTTPSSSTYYSSTSSYSTSSSTYTAPSSTNEYSSASTYTTPSSSTYYSSTSSYSTSSTTYTAANSTDEYSSTITSATSSLSINYSSTSTYTAPSSYSTSSSTYTPPNSTSSYTAPSSSTLYSSTSSYSTSNSTYTAPSSSTFYSSTSSYSTSNSTYTAPSSSSTYPTSSSYSTSSSTYTASTNSSTYSSTSTYIPPSSSHSSTSSYSPPSSSYIYSTGTSSSVSVNPSSSTSATLSSTSSSTFYSSSSTYIAPSSSSQDQISSTHVAPNSSHQQSSTIHSTTSSHLPSSSGFTSQTFSTSANPATPTTQQSATTITATPTGTSPNVATTPPPSRLYPYGSSQGDSSFGNRFIIRRRLYLKSPIYFANKFYQTLYICSSGYVTFHFSHCYYYPSSFRYYNIPLVAPFFSGNDMRHYYNTKSRVYYREYSNFDSSTSSQSILSRATTDVDQFQSQLKLHSNWTSSQLKAKFGLYHHTVNNFNAKHVVVITWTDMVPYPASYYGRFGFTNTFQLVLVSNGENTFALYNYEVNGMQWWRRFYGLRARVGYITGSTNIHHEIALSGNRNILKIDSLLGNTGMTGKWAFRLDPDTFHINYVQKCLSWYYQQNHISYYNRYMPSPCPCTWWQVWFDRRFNWWGSVARYPCAQSRFSSPTQGGGNTRMHRVCCYTTNFRRFGALITGSPSGGTLTYANKQLRDTDKEAYQNCCINSRLCFLYYRKRDSGTCRGYRPPRRTWFWGDPHIRTMDGKQYTFNGLGEYQLLNLQNNYVDVQARTSQALINGTRSAKATVFSAFAAKQNNSDVIQATLNDQNNGLDILVNGNIPLTLNDLSQNETREYNNVDLALSQNGSLVVAFSSGASLEVTVLPGLISIAVNAPASLQGNSKGLLGVWNGNMNDDFTRPDGSKILINATEFEIYYDFGEKWKINETQSLFTYPPGTTYQNFTDPDFLPLFSDNITALFGGDNDLYQQALSSCGNNIPCLYDASQTLNVELAVQGKETADGYQEAENEAENFPPVITGPTTLNVTYGKVYTTALSVSDPNTGDTVTVTADSAPLGASFNPTSYQFTWNVSTYTNISIQIVAKDSKNAASIYSPTQIIMCYCANGGTCDYTGETVEDGSVSQVPCICSAGWNGDHCTVDFDSCANFPCYENVTCTDNVAPLTGYTCGSCPQGYTGDGILCSDFDECASSATNNCQQVCVNTVGGYTCDCQSGYQLNSDGRTCTDIDECFKNSQICGQICTNTNSSYICSCNFGFNLNSDNKTCTAATACSSNNNCSESCTYINGKDQCACKNGYVLQSDGVSCADRDECADKTATCQMLCNNTIGGYQCGCPSGYTLNIDGKTCSDINECSTSNPCHSNASCQNTPGSYTCSCNSGYTGNGKTCTDINECSSSSTCGNNANCFNSAGSYNCQCKPGFYSTSSSSNMLNGNSCQKETAYELTVRIDATFNAQFNDKNSAAYKNEISKLQAAILSAYQNNSLTSNEVKVVTVTNLRQGSIIADCIVTVLKNYTQGTTLLKNIIQTGAVSSYVVQSVNVTDYNECNNPQDNSCVGNQQCINTIGSYTCNCSAGYQFNATLQQCIDINECQKSASPCHQNSDCINTAGSYQCRCKNGYIGDGKLNCTLVCTPNYCFGQGTCYVVNNAPRCNCTTTGPVGSRCVQGSTPLSSGAIVGISIGSIIAVLLIIGFVYLWFRHSKAKTQRSVTPDQGLLTGRKSPTTAYDDDDGQEHQC